jgi:membrane-bound ClpP family serine protease
MTDPHRDELDRILDRYQEKMPGWMARFVAWIRKPELRVLRIISGIVLVLCGMVGFLPILGFWMIPLGLVLLAQDIAFLRRPVVAAIEWGERKWHAWRNRAKA